MWTEPHPGADEPTLDAYAERQAGFDPDIWLVEIDDAHGRHFPHRTNVLTQRVSDEAPQVRFRENYPSP